MGRLIFLKTGQVFSLPSLSAHMDEAFIRLHDAFLGGAAYDWSHFEQETLVFFAQNDVGLTEHDAFFNSFTILWRHFINTGQLDHGAELWRMALSIALKWEEQHPDRLIHKGTPLYFWGMTEILGGNLDKGYALMHRAVAEDARTSQQDFPDTPAFALVSLNSQKVDQAFRGWVLRQAELLSRLLITYGQQTKRVITLEEI